MRYFMVLLPALILTACGAPTADTNVVTKRQPVRVLAVSSASAIQTIQGSGMVQPEESLQLSFKVGGVVKQLLVNNGDKVRAGQVLARLDDTEINAQVSQAKAAYEKAQRDLARAQSLRDQGVIAQQPVDDARTQVTVTVATLKSAEFNQSHAVITAPNDGVVLARLSEERELVAVGQSIVVIGRNDQHWNLNVGLADKDAVQLVRGQQVQIQLDAFPDQVVVGTIKRIGASAEVQTGTVKVEITLNTQLPLVAGLVGRAQFSVASKQSSSLQIPITALLEADQQQAHVFVLDAKGQQVTQRQVTLGRLLDDQSEISAGLSAGEQVVVEGAAWLNDGDAVQVLR